MSQSLGEHDEFGSFDSNPNRALSNHRMGIQFTSSCLAEMDNNRAFDLNTHQRCCRSDQNIYIVMSDDTQLSVGLPSPQASPGDCLVQHDQWHYKDERSGKRLGPVNRDQVGEMIAADRIDRSTLVWRPTMADWAAASTTELASLFGDGPPPLPASAISRWAIYALALFPLVGLVIQAIASAVLSARSGQNVQEIFDHRAWLLLFILGNGALGDIDEKNLRRAGLDLRFAATLAALVTPVYVFASCRTFKRHAARGARLAYLPLLIWVAAVAASVVVAPLLFNPDAPLIFRPDAWL